MLERGFEVYPQSLDAASHFVSMIDYPKHGYDNWQAYLKQVLSRLEIKIDSETLNELAVLYQQHNTYILFPDAASAVRKAYQLSLKTAIITTIAHFRFRSAIKSIQEYFDIITTCYEVKCEKSNPKMCKQTLQKLAVAPEEAVMVGEEPLVDIKIPEKIGMHTIFLDRQNREFCKPLEADAKATTLTEALTIVEKRLHE